MFNIGLTGGIGSGKSTVAAILRELGAPVIDADQLGHEVYRPGRPAFNDVVATFGREIVAPDGTIDRRRLGAIVFAERAALAKLEAIVHPLILAEIKARVGVLRAQGERRPIVIEAAILLEARWQDFFQEIWLVVAERADVVRRLALQRGMDATQVAARIAAQMPEAERRARATLVIDNQGNLEDLRVRVRGLWEQSLKRANDAS
ncbi:MAG TPA: dephospho-CoA kinase [Candidatus Binataceae bacterium]|nr:dephospho-CoA kinase [Candidatus Binataceae bacterium]